MDFDQFASLYQRAHDLGLKGCTSYRPNPITGAVLQPAEGTEESVHCCSLEREADEVGFGYLTAAGIDGWRLDVAYQIPLPAWREIKAVVEQGGTANEGIILEIASTLLRVEDRLEQQLLRLTHVIEPQAEHDDDGVSAEQEENFRKVVASVMRECIINLARIKETISQSLTSQAPSQGLDSMPSLVRGIKAGLLMLSKTRAMEVVERIGKIITLMLKHGGPSQLSQKETDRLADAIVSIEYYMETVKAGRSEPWYMLDNAEACLAVLDEVEGRLRQVEHAVHDVATREEEPSAATTQRIEYVDVEAMVQAAAEAVPDAPPPATQAIPPPVVVQQAEHMDPELLELFIEEAKEEIASIRRGLPKWTADPDDLETLITVRRSFHTLKGSGRMVGAERIGEYCWAVEDLLNRLINRTLQCTPPMVDFIVAAAAAVPELVEQLEVAAVADGGPEEAVAGHGRIALEESGFFADDEIQ